MIRAMFVLYGFMVGNDFLLNGSMVEDIHFYDSMVDIFLLLCSMVRYIFLLYGSVGGDIFNVDS